MKKHRIVIADDHELSLIGIQQYLSQERDLEVVGRALDGREALDLLANLQPDLFIVDQNMPGIDGIKAAKEALAIKKDQDKVPGRQWPGDLGIIMVTMFDSKNYLRRAFQAGVSAYVLKGTAAQELLEAVRAVLAGDRYISKTMAEEADNIFWEIDNTTHSEPHESLSPRELEAMDYNMRGLTDTKIAEKMNISKNTAHFYRVKVYQKLGIHSNNQLVRYGITHKLIHVDDEGKIIN